MSTNISDAHLVSVAEFPVQWENEDQESLFWMLDAVHFPDPVCPLDFSILVKAMETGVNHAAQAYEMGFTAAYLHINTYIYDGAAFELDDLQAMSERMTRSLQRLDKAAMGLGQLWDEEWLPEIQKHLAYWNAYDLQNASLSDLAAHLGETIQRWHRLWEIHFLLFYPMLLSLSNFEDMMQDMMEESDSFGIYDLLASEENKTIAGNRVLWQLSRKALAMPTVKQILTNEDAKNVISKLQEDSVNQEFLQELWSYLQSYGYRNDKLSLSTPTWYENPTPAIQNLQDYMTQPDKDLDTELAKVAQRREATLAQTQTALEGYPQPIVAEFERQQQAAQACYRLSEDHNFWIEGQGLYCVRQVVLALSQRLADAGVIATQDDIFYMNKDEIEAAATGAVPELLIEEIERRKAEEAQFLNCTPPPFLGTPPPEEVPSDDPLSRAFAKFFSPPPTQTANSNELLGYAGAPGLARGRARIIHDLAEATDLQAGDILVATTTTPTWTALFGSISAIVTDSGGILSHSAIIAREHGIAAVVGVGSATTMIADGQMIEVDGTNGTVRLLGDES